MQGLHTSRTSSRVIVIVVSAALAAIGWIVYGSPLSTHKAGPPKTRIVTVDETMPRKGHTTAPAPVDVITTPHVTVTSVQVTRAAAGGKGAAVVSTCSSYKWQQDAQAAYLADLSDPHALDGPAGPNNGNGLACDELPSDPSRLKSVAVDAFAWGAPTVPSKADVLNPSRKYFGIAEDGLPNDSSLYDAADDSLGQAPSSVEWFQNFGDAYPYTKVNTAWQRGALPVITWMSAPNGYTPTTDLTSYSLASIAAGTQDKYISTWAASIAVQKMPVVIRFDHEENGNWYPWSIGWTPNDGTSPRQGIGYNSPAAYAAAWQHVWKIFDSYHANDYAIWSYVPSRVDTLTGYASGLTQSQIVSESYPGNTYVDWVGMDGYQYNTAESTTYSDTFAKTFSLLKSFSSKPIMVAEMGSAEQGGNTKSNWIAQTIAGLAADPRVVAAIYFDNDVTGVHYINGVAVRTNWKIDSSPLALSAMRSALASSGFGQGFFPPYLLGN